MWRARQGILVAALMVAGLLLCSSAGSSTAWAEESSPSPSSSESTGSQSSPPPSSEEPSSSATPTPAEPSPSAESSPSPTAEAPSVVLVEAGPGLTGWLVGFGVAALSLVFLVAVHVVGSWGR